MTRALTIWAIALVLAACGGRAPEAPDVVSPSATPATTAAATTPATTPAMTIDATSEAAPEDPPCGPHTASRCADIGNAQLSAGHADAAMATWQVGCDGGDGTSCNNLGVLLLGQYGVAPDLAKAATHFQRACELGYADACAVREKMRARGQP